MLFESNNSHLASPRPDGLQHLQYRRRSSRLPPVLIATLVATACTAPPLWRADDVPMTSDVAQLFTAQGTSGVAREMYADEIPQVPMPGKLRPCCAFGERLRVKIGPIPIPGVEVLNIVDADDIGSHIYDSGIAKIGSRGDLSGWLHSEHNGLIYTCRGGFIDTAHVRKNADWTIFLATTLARNLEKGVKFKLPDEGGSRSFLLLPFTAEEVQQIGRRAIAIPLGQWMATQLSTWHEIVTWFGWSSVPGFPEKVSAFSPEDLYSNLVGARLTAAIASQRTARDEYLYNRSLDQWVQRVLRYLQPVSRDVGLEAMASLDGSWWDSRRRLPDSKLVTRRNLDIGRVLKPWRVPPERAGKKLQAACGTGTPAQPIEAPDATSTFRFRDHLTLTIEPPSGMLAKPPFSELEAPITQEDFPAITAFIRAQVLEEFGPGSDQPN